MPARYRRILLFFARILLGVIVWDVLLRNLGLRALARRSAAGRYTAAAGRFRALAVEMGGVLIKVGQFLSARVDVLPACITDELAGLQDEVPAEDFAAVRAVLEAELGAPPGERFADFDRIPLAAASLGQAHRATLPSGERVVVKVQRPDIHALVETDLAALRTVAGWIKRYRPISRRANVQALLAEFSRVLREEMDYAAEAENAARFGRMFAADPHVRVPRVIASHSTARVLTLEDVYFIKISDYAGITAAGVDRAEVAQRLFETYLRQIFIEGFFHADPHPGNLFVEPPGEEEGTLRGKEEEAGTREWRLVFVDFGMVGRVSQKTRAGLRELAIAVGTRDPARVVRAYHLLDVLLPGADLERLKQAETAIFDQFWGKSMGELRDIEPREYARRSMQFRDLLYELPFQVPEDMIFLGRCVAILSGMCTGLDPDFNLFEGLAPFAVQLLAGERGEGLDAGAWLKQALEQARMLLALPGRLERLLARLESGDPYGRPARPDPELLRRLDRGTRALHRVALALLAAGLLIAAPLAALAGWPTLVPAAVGLAALLALWALLGLRRDRP
ncbi:MAG: AarF/ABC1/UbiB kinase family protein [Chloroflexi bacterium]|nr:AarF/ABC1/UbiB kinase family protein [Chloroflexota bacterium]